MSQGNQLTTAMTTRVLLIEADTSLRRLISLGLQHRGMHVIEAASPACVPLCDMQQVDLLVLDVDTGVKQNWSYLEALQLHPTLSALPVVVLAWDYELTSSSPASAIDGTPITCLAKPFDARVLHEAVDELINARAAQEAAVEARKEEILLAAYSAQTSPSLWPIITAAGLLLTVIGLMLQAALVALGFLIVIIAMLLWMLGSKPEQRSIAVL